MSELRQPKAPEGMTKRTRRREPPVRATRRLEMSEIKKIDKQAAGAKKLSEAAIKGKIFEFVWTLKKQGYADKSIKTYESTLWTLKGKGANILNPESVKETLMREKFSAAYKRVVIYAYTRFLQLQGLTWNPPFCKVSRKLPFIPLEREIDYLIAGCGRKTACFLQLLKETGMRCGEALSLKWTDIDFKRKIIILNTPEKHGNPRILPVSRKLIDMLNSLPRKHEKIFNCLYTSMRSTFAKARKRLAKKLGNPRLEKINFHTLRHWKATMEYHKTKDILHVKQLLGHKSMDTTLLYIQVEKSLFREASDEFTVKVASDPEEIKALLEVGFEYVCEQNGLMFFRKRK